MQDPRPLTPDQAVQELRELRTAEPRSRLRAEAAVCILWGVLALAWFFSHHAIGASFGVFESFALLILLLFWGALGTLVTYHLWQAYGLGMGATSRRAAVRASALMALVLFFALLVSIGIHEILEPAEPFWLADFFPPLLLILILGLATSVLGWTNALQASADVKRVLQNAGLVTIVVSLSWAILWDSLRRGFDENFRWVGGEYHRGQEYLPWSAELFLQSLPGALALSAALILGGIWLARKG